MRLVLIIALVIAVILLICKATLVGFIMGMIEGRKNALEDFHAAMQDLVANQEDATGENKTSNS